MHACAGLEERLAAEKDREKTLKVEVCELEALKRQQERERELRLCEEVLTEDAIAECKARHKLPTPCDLYFTKITDSFFNALCAPDADITG